MPVVLYGCETWSLTLREVHWLRVFENRVMSKIFGLERDVVTRNWMGVHNVELRHLNSVTNIVWVIKSRGIRWMGLGACMRERIGAFCWGNLTESDNVEDLRLDGRVIL